MKLDIIRAWKDETYRQSLDNEQIHSLPVNPAGELELTEADLQAISGGWGGVDGGFGGGWDGCGGNFFGMQEEFFNSNACVCQNPIFSNNNIRHVVLSAVRTTNICNNFN